MQCTAHSSRTGQQCLRHAVAGSTVCRHHGAGAPQVKAAAARRVSEAEAREKARRRLVKAAGGIIEDPLQELAELAAEIRAVRVQLAGRMAQEPSEMVALLAGWGAAASLLAKCLVDLLRFPRFATAMARSDVPEPAVTPEFVGAVLTWLGYRSDNPIPDPSDGPPLAALPSHEDEATEDAPEPIDDQAEALSREEEDEPRPAVAYIRELAVQRGERLCRHQQVSMFNGPAEPVVVCAHCSQEWPMWEAVKLGIWLTG